MRTRNYSKEYRDYQGKPTQLKRRAARNAARRLMERKGRVRKGDGKEVDHKDFNPKNNALSNLRITPRSVNRRRQP